MEVEAEAAKKILEAEAIQIYRFHRFYYYRQDFFLWIFSEIDRLQQSGNGYIRSGSGLISKQWKRKWIYFKIVEEKAATFKKLEAEVLHTEAVKNSTLPHHCPMHYNAYFLRIWEFPKKWLIEDRGKKTNHFFRKFPISLEASVVGFLDSLSLDWHLESDR